MKRQNKMKKQDETSMKILDYLLLYMKKERNETIETVLVSLQYDTHVKLKEKIVRENVYHIF